MKDERLLNGPSTTARLRAQAYDAARALDYEMAATLYEQAADAYPTTTGALAKRDIAALRVRAATYRQAAMQKGQEP